MTPRPPRPAATRRVRCPVCGDAYREPARDEDHTTPRVPEDMR
jgi:ribosomal protein S27E